MVTLGKADPGDFCYFVAADNKIRRGEILSIIIKGEAEPIMKMQCQENWSFHIAIMRLAAWESKYLKGLKWDVPANMSPERTKKG